MLKVRQLSCERGRRSLFQALDFDLAASQGLQILGGNGQGKSTLLRILVGLYSEYEGEVDWDLELPPLYLGHRIGVKHGLTVIENLNWQLTLRSDLTSKAAIADALEALGLLEFGGTLCASLSEGQRKRVGLARYLLLEHKCWILDEPFSSLDADGVTLLRDLMNQHIESGGSAIFTSHQPVELSAGLNTVDLS